jgi:hypothetical protein
MHGTGVEEKGIRIAADADIVVYVNNMGQETSDSFLALARDVLGTEYIVPSYPQKRRGASPSQLGKMGVHRTLIRTKTTRGLPEPTR